MMEDTNHKTMNDERCFVCDGKVQGRFYVLATCKTQTSRSRVIEKLGELVGERYMVVITEDDMICRSCANLINTLDRLEVEMRNIRDHILGFIEQKYSLEEGELQSGGDKPKPCQPPQITKCNAKDITSCCAKQSEIDFRMKKQKKSHSWLQCDKCKYTTHVNSFMMHHIRDHMKHREICDKCGLCANNNCEEAEHGCGTNESENKENEKVNLDVAISNNPIEMTSLSQNNIGNMQQISPFVQTTPPPLIGLSNCDHLYISNIVLSAGDPLHTSYKQPMYILQQINADDVNTSTERMTRITEVNATQET